MHERKLLAAQHLLIEQKSQLMASLSPLLKQRNVHFFDVSVHTNTGDSLIFAGTMQLLDELDAKVIGWNSIYHRGVLDASSRYWRKVKQRIDTEDVIICQGGGNFGDIYERHQLLRKLTVSAFADNTIIVFPQSVHFSCEEKLSEDLRIFAAAKNLFICVRDQHSLTTLKNNGIENVLLVPDIATCLVDSINPINTPTGGTVLNFLRADVEATGSQQEDGQPSVDWEDLNPVRCEKNMLWLRKFAGKNGIFGHNRTWWNMFYDTHHALIKNANEHFSQFEVIRTDRLHGMILSQLLGLKCERLDNSYGKLVRYATKWLGESDSSL